MLRSYKHLTQEQRYEIRAMYLQGISYRQMSSILGLSPSTISREIRRNSGFRGYRPKQAQRHIWIDKSVGGILWQHLRRSRKRYRKRSSGKDLRGQIVNRRS
ncbi:MAG: helix-turn-helix domain-containing protein, partial [Bacteroidetes bacterium]|jgi:IS30 family transposase|nr:helix-turn-helix domain-containing protein [Bacteroidota bacterium]